MESASIVILFSLMLLFIVFLFMLICFDIVALLFDNLVLVVVYEFRASIRYTKFPRQKKIVDKKYVIRAVLFISQSGSRLLH